MDEQWQTLEQEDGQHTSQPALMPCRANGCRRAAVQVLRSPTSHIWISEDALDNAIARFARTATRSHKRHGSNIPGPLEARRRLTKRRMGGLAASKHIQEGGPFRLSDLAFLFGNGSIETGWTYKPPAPSSQKPARSLPLEVDLPDSFKAALDIPSLGKATRYSEFPADSRSLSSLLEECSDLHSIGNIYRSLHPRGEDAVVFSRLAFQRLLSLAAGRITDGTLSAEHIQDAIAFLLGEMDQVQAHNSVAFLQWAIALPEATSLPRDFATVIRDKIELRSLPASEIVSVLDTLPKACSVGTTPHEKRTTVLLSIYESLVPAVMGYISRSAGFVTVNKNTSRMKAGLQTALDSLPESEASLTFLLKNCQQLPEALRSSIMALTSQRLASWVQSVCRDSHVSGKEHISYMSDFISPIMRETSFHWSRILVSATASLTQRVNDSAEYAGNPMACWLNVLSDCQKLLPDTDASAMWESIYPSVANVLKPHEIASHFALLNSPEAARILLRYWQIPGLMRTTQKTLTAAGEGIVRYQVDVVGQRNTATAQSRSWRKVRAAFEQSLTVEQAKETPLSRFAPFTSALAILDRRHKYIDPVLHDTFKLLMKIGAPHEVFSAFMTLTHRHAVVVPPSSALPIIQFFLRSGNTGHALRVFDNVPGVWLSQCPKLPLALIEEGSFSPVRLFDMLNRSEYANSVAVGCRSEPTNTLTQERVDLIHLLAHAYAKSPHLSARMAFRRVSDLYRYLQDRQAPLSSLLSRSMVYAGVTRYLREEKWVSTVRFLWILDLVRRIEGDDIASLLDKLTWIWRNKVYFKKLSGTQLASYGVEADQIAQDIRWQCGHPSHRWKRKTKLLRPPRDDIERISDQTSSEHGDN